MNESRQLFRIALLCAGAAAGWHSRVVGQAPRTENVVLVTIDGVRWEEVFRGADTALMTESQGVTDAAALRAEFWRDTEQQRRVALMPFFWGEIARAGQIYGNRDAGSSVLVANGKNFSFPGYSEILTGFPDDRIDSNAKRHNPNETVLGWLHDLAPFDGRVVAFGSWDVFPYIVNTERSGVPVNAGWIPFVSPPATDAQRALNSVMAATPREWDNVRFDAFTLEGAMQYLRYAQPRVLYLALGEPDDWAHGRRYDRYLRSTKRFDRALERLWTDINELPAYRGRTTVVVTTDHGRGPGPSDWTGHGSDVPGSEYIWLAAIGPDTPALGERRNVPTLYQGQVAATVAALLGLDYRHDIPRAAPAVTEVVRAHER